MILFLLWLMALLPTIAFGYGITHLIRPNSNFDMLATQGVCSVYRKDIFLGQCNAGNYSHGSGQGIIFNSILKSDGQSINTGKELVFNPVSKEYLQGLFSDNNLISFQMDSGVSFKTSKFVVTYTPYFIVADAYFMNPAFPEIALFVANQKSLRITSGFDLGKKLGYKNTNWDVGFSFYQYGRDFSKQNILLASIAANTKDLIQLEKQSGVAFDLGTSFTIKNLNWFPVISVQAKNINSKYRLDASRIQSSRNIEPFLLFETYSSLGLGYVFDTQWGGFKIGTETKYKSVFSEYYQNYTALSGQYSLGLFSFSLATSKYLQTTGVHFLSQMANIGILYSSENEMPRPSLSKTKVDSVYLSIEVML